MINLLKESEKWKREADKIISTSKLQNILKKYGNVEFSGAFSADLMMSGDIDIYVVNKSFTKKNVLEVFNKLANLGFFEGYFFYDWKKNKHPNFPSAYYVGLKTKVKNIKWKVDIWFLTEDDLKKIDYYNLKKIKLNKKQKIAILKFKRFRDKFLINISSTVIYNAVIKNNILTIESFKKFIKK